jgi:hypothetical protein
MMMRLWKIALTLCFLAASIEGRNNLRSLQEDSPVASPTQDREGEPTDVFVEESPETPSPTAANDVPAAAPTPADNGGEDASPTADGVFDDAGGDNAGDLVPTAAPTYPDDAADEAGGDGNGTDGDVTPANEIPETTPAAGDGDGGDTEGTLVPNDENPESTPEAAGDDQGDGGNEETVVPESTQAPSIASDGEVPEPTQAPSEQTPAPIPDTINVESPTYAPTEDGGDGGGDEFDEWDNYTPPTEPPVVYVPPDEEQDPIKNANTTGSWMREGETPEDMIHDRNVLIAASVLCGVGILLMIITAHQMVENPDGCCARYVLFFPVTLYSLFSRSCSRTFALFLSVCRLITGCTCCIFRTICFPCRACCGGGGRKRRTRQHQMLGNGNYTHDLELS